MRSIEKAIQNVKVDGIVEKEKSDKVIEHLQKSAKSFLNDVNKLLIQYNKIQQAVSLGDLAYAIAGYTKQELQLVRDVYVSIHTFENALNHIFKKEEFLTFVDEETGQLLFSDSQHTGSLYKEAIQQKAQGGGGAFPAFETIKKYAKGMPDKYKEVQTAIEKSHNQRNEVYKSIRARFMNSLKEPPKTESGKRLKARSKAGHVYKNLSEGRKRFTSNSFVNQGVIAEGYARVVIDQDPEIKNFGGPYDPLFEAGLWKLATVYAVKDSKAGSIEGDIVKRNFHFAVKKAGADLARIPQYVKLAQSIMLISSNSALTAQLYKTILPKIINANPKAENYVNKIIAAASQTSVKKIKEQLIKISRKDFGYLLK